MAKKLPPDQRPSKLRSRMQSLEDEDLKAAVARPSRVASRPTRPAKAAVGQRAVTTLPPKPPKTRLTPLTQSDLHAIPAAPRPVGLPRRSQQVQQFTAWSYSRYRDWVQCPRAAKYKHLDKMKEEPSAAMLRGIDIGNRLEAYLKGETNTLPDECMAMKDRYVEIRKAKPFVEQMWGLDAEWNPVPWNDWKSCQLRVKMDIAYQEPRQKLVHVLDNKTGQFKERDIEVYLEQLDIYVAAGAVFFPTATEFAPRLLYSDLNIEFPELDDQGMPTFTYTKKEALTAQLRWDAKVKPMLADTRFPTKPGNHCRWCVASKAKGGPCEY